METPTRAQQLQWVRQYKDAAVALEEVHAEELQALTDERAMWITEELLSLPVANRRRESSGLVEQQAWFQKLHHL